MKEIRRLAENEPGFLDAVVDSMASVKIQLTQLGRVKSSETMF